MKLLDRYIFNEFFRTFIGALALLTGIGIISKIMERLGTIISYTGPVINLLIYIYLNIPYIVTIVGPMALMFSISFTVANFSRKKELAVMMTSGRSFRRIIAPIVLFSFFYSIGNFFLTEYVSYPWFLQSFDHYHDVLRGGHHWRSGSRSNFHGKIDRTFLYIGHFDREYNLVTSINLIQFGKNSPEYIINADYAIVVPRMWIILNGSETDFKNDFSIKSHHTFKMQTVRIKEGSDFLKTHAHTWEEMSVFQVYKEMREHKKFGSPSRKHLVEFYWHFSVPFVSLFIVLIAGILGSQVKKGAMSMSITISTVTTLAYYLLMYIGKSLGVSGVLPPFIGAWLANIGFTILGIFLYSKYRI